MRILIVDDEMMISQWLEFTISSLLEGDNEIESAANGEEALDMIKHHSYDLIFVDVLMPKLNGIDLLRELNALGCDAMLIVLSSHDEFKFAKEAIKYHVHEYVLKNECSKEKLAEILSECRQRKQQFNSKDELSEDQMYRIIQENATPQTVEEITGMCPYQDTCRYSVLVVLNRRYDLPEKFHGEAVICDIVKRLGRTEWYSWYLVSVHGAGDIISYNQVRQQFAEYLLKQLNVPVVLSRFFNRGSDIVNACRDAWIGYQHLFYENRPYAVGPVKYRKFDSEEVDSLCDRTLTEIRLYEEEQTVNNLEKLNDYFRQHRPTDVEAVKNIYLAILSTFIIYNNKKSRKVTEKLDTIRSELAKFTQFEDLARWAVAIVKHDMELIERRKFSSSVEEALEYIEEHFQTIKTVNEIAEHVNLSPDYFSRCFKREVKVSLNTYLINYRLDKASIILLSSNLSVQEVAKKVGIENGSYFSKCFKKKFHTQPIRFRIQTKN